MLFLLDKSAHEVASRDELARSKFEALAVSGVLATCAMVELEILYSARSVDHHAKLKAYLRKQCVWLETTDSVLQDSIDLQERMLKAGLHRKPLPDLIIAAVALHHNAVVVHRDKDFGSIAQVAPLQERRIVAT